MGCRTGFAIPTWGISNQHLGSHGYIHRKEDYLKRLRRIEGQARGLQKMVESEQHCIDILTPIARLVRS